MSSDSERYVLHRLNNNNYAEWALRMEAVLIKKGLWDNVVEILVSDTLPDGNPKPPADVITEFNSKLGSRDTSKMAEARAELILRVEAGQLAHMTSRDPRVIWESLERMHRAAGFATSLALRRQFLTSKKAEHETMEAWIGRIQGMVLRMEYAGIDVTAQDKILAFTMGLPAAYEAVIVNFDATPPSQLTVEHVISRLLNEETRQQSLVEPASADANPNNVAYAAATRRRTGQVTAAPDTTCFFCDKKGHFKSDCPERRRWEAAKDAMSETTNAILAVDSDEDYEGVW
ncbi:CCHC-type domain-containing protein [Mycena venus]|uniref:CCHC-type domain-containing protein n=1 Tax=Mycena venus TaxID=2733690 RepID=A0A8H6XH89_9AGAR|nr:CCHC-type domain-containing protein [Mycena venus]